MDKCSNMYILKYVFIVVSIIFIWGFIKSIIGSDFLLTNIGIWDLDIWSITHFICFFIMTYVCPKKWKLLFIIGVVWELFEQFYGYLPPALINNLALDYIPTDNKNQKWWYGRFSDIICNSLGIMLAIHLNK